MGEERQKLLRTQGLACIRIPRHKRYPSGVFNWLTADPDVTRTDVKWYTDGSCSDPTCPDVAKLGFGIAVVDSDGGLVAYGAGIPPSFVTDSGMAELWAVWTAIESCPATPNIITDCLGILNTAKAGTAAATSPKNVSARTWRLIAGALEGDVGKLAEKLVWMPAHQTRTAIGNRFRSDGRRISCVDFRANRLVDKLAAFRHEKNIEADKGKKLLQLIRSAAKTSLAVLGQVTWAANNCEQKVTGEDGAEKKKVYRDSTSRPNKSGQSRRKAESSDAKEKEVKESSETFSVREIQRIKQAWRRKQNRTARQPSGKKKNKLAPTLSEQANRPQDKGEIARYTEILSEAAQEHKGQYVSFQSFLGITASVERIKEAEAAQTSSEGGDRRAPNSAATSSSVSDTSTLLERTGTTAGPVRSRPTRSVEPLWSSKKESDKAINLLLTGAKKRKGTVVKTGPKEPAANAQYEESPR